MPVVINKETGLAEDLPSPLVVQALEKGTHLVPLNDLEGKPVTAPYADMPGLLKTGFTQPSPDQLAGLMRFAKASSPTSQAKAFAEGAGEGSTFGASTAAEVAGGVDPQDIIARKEANPVTAQIGQMAGLMGSSLTPVGEGAILEKLGGGAVKALGLAQPTTALARIGSQAVKEAIAFAGIQSGDEVSKMVLGESDPDAPAQTALAHIGLSGLIGGFAGGAFGAVSPLWKATKESRLGQYLSALRDKADGLEPGARVEGAPYRILESPTLAPAEGEQPSLPGMAPPEAAAAPPRPNVEELAARAGIKLTPEMKGALEANPEWANKARVLAESATKRGVDMKTQFDELQKSIHDSVLKALDVTPEDVTAAQAGNEYDIGLSFRDAIAQDVDRQMNPLAKSFAETREAYKNLPIGEATKAKILEAIATLSREKGYYLESTPESNLVNKALKWINQSENLQELRVIYTTIGRQAEADQKLWQPAMDLNKVIQDAEDSVIARQVAKDNPAMVGKNRQDREAYSALMDNVRYLANRLHPGAFSGPDSFLTKLFDMNPETVLRRLTPSNDSNLLNLVKHRFPTLLPEMRQAYMKQLLKAASVKAEKPYSIQPWRAWEAIAKWGDDLKKFALPGGAEEAITAAKELAQLSPYERNSATFKNMDTAWSKVPGGAMAMLAMAEGHNPIWGYIMGQGARMLSREVPDAMTYATLKLMGENKPVNASAFNTMALYLDSVIKGESKLTNAVKSVFKQGARVLPDNLYPKPERREKLKRRLASLEQEPGELMDVGGDTGYYAPQHGAALSNTAARAINALTAMQPSLKKYGVLNEPRDPARAEHAAYENALDIAEQPMITLDRLKDGTLTGHDVETLRSLYPAFHTRASEKLMHEMTDHLASGESIPWNLRMSLSRFMGVPLDGSLTPQAIAAAQTKPPQAQLQAPQKPGKGSPKALKKFAAAYQTSTQHRAADRSGASG